MAASANSAVCKKTFRDFPNSLDNSAICNKVKSEGKKFDWLRKNRALCEESKDFFDNFISSFGDSGVYKPSLNKHLNNVTREKKITKKQIFSLIVSDAATAAGLA